VLASGAFDDDPDNFGADFVFSLVRGPNLVDATYPLRAGRVHKFVEPPWADDGTVEELQVRPPTPAELPALHRMLADAWGAPTAVAHGTVYRLAELPALVAVHAGQLCGAVTLSQAGRSCQLVSVNAFRPRHGVGTALVERAARQAAADGCGVLRCTTTNDNLDALRFYQRRGFRLIRIRPGAVEAARLIKPQIPAIGQYGIPLRDELDLERVL
jgi:GNAT superfamily N-acetyltransferase